MKILVAGGGAFGKEHLKTLRATGGLTLALAEPRDGEREALREEFGLADCDADAFTLLDRFQPDGVVIATPAHVHALLAIAALGRSIPALVEKPVTPDSVTMRQLADAADASPAFLLPGHILRFSPAHRQLRDILFSGEIGDLVQFTSRRYRDDGHAMRYVDIDPVLMTMIHDIDLALWFSGATASSALAVRRSPQNAHSLTVAHLNDTSGALWHLTCGWMHPSDACPPDRVEIIGTRGGAELHVGSHIEIHAQEPRRLAVDAAEDPLRVELECFLSGIGSGKLQAPVLPRDALEGLLAAEMIVGALAR